VAPTRPALIDAQSKPRARVIVRRIEGILLSPFEQAEIGPDLFGKASEFNRNYPQFLRVKGWFGEEWLG
jgi:hypothetical protein